MNFSRPPSDSQAGKKIETWTIARCFYTTNIDDMISEIDRTAVVLSPAVIL